MNNKKAKKLRRGVELACAGQPIGVQEKILKLVKKNSGMFTTGDSLKVTAMKIIALVKREIVLAKAIQLKKSMSKLSASGQKAALAGKKFAKAARGVEVIPNVN